MVKTFKLIIALLFIAWGLCVIMTLQSCSVEPYSNKWKNTYIWFEPDNMEAIYISNKGIIETSQPVFNGTEYQVNFTKESGNRYRLSFTSSKHPIHFAYFSGFAAANYEEEIPWIKEGNTFSLVSNRLLSPEDGMYMISLSQDLQR